MASQYKWCLAGIPDHEAVANLGGRLGAAYGPASFRKIFDRFSGRDGVRESMHDAGDVSPIGQNVETNHRLAADFVRECQSRFGLTVVVGGSHDHGYSHLTGIRDTQPFGKGKKPRLGCINIDAHLDVRKPSPDISSGSPFYLAVEAGIVDGRDLVEFGIQRHCNAPALWEYAEQKQMPIVPFEDLRHGKAAAAFRKSLKKLASRCDFIVISLDIDAVASAFAPGVSAPQAEGFTPTDILEMMTAAGQEKKVVSLGIFELNPEHDLDQRTARLCATAAYHFVAAALPVRTPSTPARARPSLVRKRK